MANPAVCNPGSVTMAVFVDSLRFASIDQEPVGIGARSSTIYTVRGHE
jgi:hypothetical protein